MLSKLRRRRSRGIVSRMAWVVYLLRCNDGTLYAGMTNDLASRLMAHESGKGAKYTRGRGPFEVLRVWRCRSRSSALKREYRLKQLPRAGKLALCSPAA